MILENIVWSFDNDLKTLGADENWHPNEVILSEPRICILYQARIKDLNDLLPGEILADDETFDEDNRDDGYYEAEILAPIEADNARDFTALELLTKIHRHLSAKELGDHIFFEGIIPQNETYNDLPVFYISTGS